MGENTDKNTDKRLENLRPPWKPGESGNPSGRPEGQKNYATLYREALIKLAQANGVEPDALELEIMANALLNARNGNYRFFKDMMDRLFGKAVQPIVGKFNHQVETVADLISKVEAEAMERAKAQESPRSASEVAGVATPAQAPAIILLPARTETPLDPANRPALPLPTE